MENDIYDTIYGFKNIKNFLPKDELDISRYDIVILFCEDAKIDQFKERALNLGFSEQHMVPRKVMECYGFDMDCYLDLKKDTPTIIASNCWGGLTYNLLSLRFNSPTINMYFSSMDYLKFCFNLKQYLTEKLVLQGYQRGAYEKTPICKCGDILLYFNHYPSFEDAVNAWERRKARMNFNNMLFMHYSEDMDICRKFLTLPAPKILFSPYDLDSSEAFYVKYRNAKGYDKLEFWKIINRYARYQIAGYDVFSLLKDKKIVRIAEYQD